MLSINVSLLYACETYGTMAVYESRQNIRSLTESQMAEVSTQIREIENICKEITPFFDFSVQYGKKW